MRRLFIMGLDFTGIKDEHGAAIFILHDGTEQGKNDFLRLAEEVKKHTTKQVIFLSAKDEIGSKIVRFYALKGTKFVLVVRDDDQIHGMWSDGELFNPNTIAYTAEQAG